MKRTFFSRFVPIVILVAILSITAFADDVIMDGAGFFDSTVVTGDVNLDGEVDMNDAVLLLQHSMFPEIYPLSYTASVDFNKDGEVDMNDAILLLQHSMFPDIYPLS